MKKLLLTFSFLISIFCFSRAQIVISEIMYNPAEAGTDTTEFIELYNSGVSPVDLINYTISIGIIDTFRVSTVIPAGGYVIVCGNASGFTNTYGIAPTKSWISGTLNNTGEAIVLKDASGNIVDSVFYSDTAPWPGGFSAGRPDGGGASVVLCDPNSDNSNGANWRPSTTAVGAGLIVNNLPVTSSPFSQDSACNVPQITYPLYPVGTVTSVDANGNLDSINVTCELRGVVHSIDFDGNAGYDITLIDFNHNGISLFSPFDLNGYTNPALGDSIHVKGRVSQFNGLSQLVLDSVFFISAGNTLLNPIALTAVLDESKENKLVGLTAVTLVNPAQWTGTGTGFNVDVTDGTNNWTVRIDNDCVWYGLPAPSGQIDVVGTVNQFDTLSPFDAGYQIRPRIITDITTQASAPTVFFTGSSRSVNENAGTVTLTLNILNPDANATTVDLRIGTSSTATATDYTNFTPTTVTFPASSSAQQQVSIDIIDDALVESAESIIVEIFNPTNNALLGADSVYTITINDNDVAATPAVKLVFNELLYNNPGADSVEFIEIYNNDTVTVNLAGYQVTNGIFITFPSHSLAPGAYVVITQDSVLFQQRFGVAAYRWNPGNSLNNTSEPLVLKNNLGDILDSINYQITTPWPIVPVGNAPSIQLCDPNSDNNDGSNWRISSVPSGAIVNNIEILATPGSANSICRASYPLESIGNIDNVDGNGTPDSIGLNFEIRGIVHCSDFRVGTGLEFYLINYNNEGVKVFSPSDRGYTVNDGDSLHVLGTVNQLSGMTEFRADTLFLISVANATLSPTVINSPLSENEEGSFIKLNNVSIVNPTQWTGTGGGFNVDVTNGNTTWQMRIDDAVDLFTQPAPVGIFNVYGFGGQFDSSTPFTSGYQLIACSSSISTGTQDLEDNNIAIFPNPATDFVVIKATNIENVTISNILGQTVKQVNNINTDLSTIELSELSPGVYNVAVMSRGQITVKQIVKR